MTILIAPDKFKGSLTTFEACNAIAAGCRATGMHLVRTFPMADGGDGFAAVMKYYLHTETVTCATVDPLGTPIAASYEWQPATQTAIVELASASGLALLQPHQRDVMRASTLGTGILIADAMAKGARHIILGLGGSATNDAGTGILAGMGFAFEDSNGYGLTPSGGSLHRIRYIQVPQQLPLLKFTVAADVTNPLHGPNGAAYVYAAQKGAGPQQIAELDKGLEHYASVLKELTGKDVAHIPGTGAAGGIAASLLPWFDVTIKSGADLVIAASGIESAMEGAHWLITGEGHLDGQSLQGKLVGRLVQLAGRHSVPVAALCGKVSLPEAACKQAGLSYALGICEGETSVAWCMEHAAELLADKTRELLRMAGL